MKKEIKDLKRVNLIATIFDPKHSEDEDWDEVVMEILIPKWEWTRLLIEGCFSCAYQEVIEGYKKYFSNVTHIDDISISFEEIKETKEV